MPPSNMFPAEWEEHEAIWTAIPADVSLWGVDLYKAQEEFIQMALALTEQPGSEKLKILAGDPNVEALVKSRIPGAQCLAIPYGDIWLRDTAPLFVRCENGDIEAATFKFNGWGSKYVLKYDNELSKKIAELTGFKKSPSEMILEGGSIEVDGKGTLLTTEQCLLNKNRNSKMSRQDVEVELSRMLGAKKVLWIKEGLLNDHTDGHIDTIVRFIGDSRVLCMAPVSTQDPNYTVLNEIMSQLNEFTDCNGRKLDVFTVPSPGKITNSDGNILAASYVNFIIGNRTVVVPTYGSPHDGEALKVIGKLFKNRKTIGVSARAILMGGGAFHCITQQQPRKGV